MIDRNKEFRNSMRRRNDDIDIYPFSADERLLEAEFRRLQAQEEAKAVGERIAKSKDGHGAGLTPAINDAIDEMLGR